MTVRIRFYRWCVLATAFLLNIGLVNSTRSQEIKVAEPLELVRVYADSEGESHFGLKQVPFELADFAPPAPPISVSRPHATGGLVFISSPVGWHGDWHPTPHIQVVFCLAGELEVTVSDGETRTFGPGSAVLVEDTVGKGHVSRVVGGERCFMASMTIEEAAE